MLIISGVLLTIDSLELHQLILTWNSEYLKNRLYFESFIMWDILTRITISIFSIASGISAFILALLLLIDIDYFLDKLLSTFLYFNYIIFGPILLTFCILGFTYCNKVLYTLTNTKHPIRIVSYSTLFSLICGLLISTIITFSVAVFKAVNTFVDSTTRKPDGNTLIRKAFWWIVFKNKDPAELIRNRNRSGEMNTSSESAQLRVNI
jgi:hypothetical protein